MPAIVKLELYDQEMTILQVKYQLNQRVHGNRVKTVVKGGIIHMVVKSSENEDVYGMIRFK